MLTDVSPRSQVTWYLIADGAQARVIARTHGTFQEVTALASAEARLPSNALGTDKPGRTVESAGPGRHMVEPKTDPQQQAKSAFARQVADQINEADKRARFDQLAVIAPPKVLSEIRSHLGEAINAKVIAALPKDLTKLPDLELHDRLKAIPLPLV